MSLPDVQAQNVKTVKDKHSLLSKIINTCCYQNANNITHTKA